MFKADLHIHTALSPCASEEMTPSNIIKTALEREIAFIAICDHNTAGNVSAVQKSATDEIAVLAGIEITTAEEVHILGLFPDAEAAQKASDELLPTLPDTRSSAEEEEKRDKMASGKQSSGKKMSASASSLTLSRSLQLIRKYEGLTVAAHIDRPSFSLISQLGMFPEDADFDAVEVSAAGVREDKIKEFLLLGLPVLASSDSHSLDEIGTVFTKLRIRTPCFQELKLALQGEYGRRISYA